MSCPVFISYSRSASATVAHTLAAGLGGLAFVDTGSIEDGDQFPQHLLDAILDASVVVIFATTGYAMSHFCRLEMRLSLAGGDATASHLVVALGEGFHEVLDALPEAVANGSWPAVEDAQRLERLVRQRLTKDLPTIRHRLTADEARRLSTAFLNESTFPQPQPLDRTLCSFPPGLAGASIGRRFVGRADVLRKIHQILSDEVTFSPVAKKAAKGGKRQHLRLCV